MTRLQHDGDEIPYITTAHGNFFLVPESGNDPEMLALDKWSLDPVLPFQPTFEEKGLILKALYQAAEDYIRKHS